MTFEEFKLEVVEAAKASGLKDYELYYTESDSLEISIFQQEVDGYKAENTLGVCFRCIVDGRTGYASTENLSSEDAKIIVEHAIENAKSIENDDPSFIHGNTDTYEEVEKNAYTNPSSKELIDFAKNLQEEMYAADKRIVDGTQSVSGAVKEKVAIVNSNGLDLMDESNFSFCYTEPILAEGDEKYIAFKVASGDYHQFDAKSIAKEAAERVIATIGADSLPSGKYKAVLAPKVMYTFLMAYDGVFFGESAQKGLSLLKGKEGEMIAAELITITDDAMEASSLTKRSFDDEGVATYKKNVVENGTLKTLLYNLKSASVAGVKSTGNGFKGSYTAPVSTSVGSFYINAGQIDKEELYRMVGDGVLVTDISGLHAGANPITGDFSLLSEGFLITDGKKGAPIKNFTISGNFYDLLKDVKALGSDFEFSETSFSVHRWGSPSAYYDEINVAGK